jgi:shikimate dehydrogenase
MIDGNTTLIAHLGYPTKTFKAPMIFNPYFQEMGINAVVMTMGVTAEDYSQVFPAVFKLTNIRGSLVTMPHKVSTVAFLDEVSTAVKVAGACNAVLRRPDGTLHGDLFDGEGFVRGIQRKGWRVQGARALVVGCGGVGSAIAAALAGAGTANIALYDVDTRRAEGLAARLKRHYAGTGITTGSNTAAGHDIVVNATPLGMNADDPMPIDVGAIAPSTRVADVVMREELTPFLRAVRQHGCEIQVGVDMVFEQVPLYLELFGFPTTTPDKLRTLARIEY